MDRKIKSNKGFTLIEVLIVVAILAIVLAIAIPSILGWIRKYNIESDTKKIYAFLQDARAKAFAEKIKLKVNLSGNQLCIQCDTSDTTCTSTYGTGNIECVGLKYNFSSSSSDIKVSKRGTFSGGSIYYPSSNSAQYDCVVISDIRIKLEKCNGSSP